MWRIVDDTWSMQVRCEDCPIAKPNAECPVVNRWRDAQDCPAVAEAIEKEKEDGNE